MRAAPCCKAFPHSTINGRIVSVSGLVVEVAGLAGHAYVGDQLMLFGRGGTSVRAEGRGLPRQPRPVAAVWDFGGAWAGADGRVAAAGGGIADAARTHGSAAFLTRWDARWTAKGRCPPALLPTLNLRDPA